MLMMLSISKTYQMHPPITHLLSQRRARMQLRLKLRQQVLMRMRMKRMGRVTWSLLLVGKRACPGSGASCRDMPLLGLCQMPLWDTTCVRGMHCSLPGYAACHIDSVHGRQVHWCPALPSTSSILHICQRPPVQHYIYCNND